jgi:hypothetical protein
MVDDEKGFDSKIKGMYSGCGCGCQTGFVEKSESDLKQVKCRSCGKIFKTNRDTDLCISCEKKHR